MQDHERTFLGLVLVGALLALGNLLNGSEPVTLRIVFARVILGSGVAVAAGAVLLLFPNISPLATIGLGSALGIIGHSCLEEWLRMHGSNYLKRKSRGGNK